MIRSQVDHVHGQWKFTLRSPYHYLQHHLCHRRGRKKMKSKNDNSKAQPSGAIHYRRNSPTGLRSITIMADYTDNPSTPQASIMTDVLAFSRKCWRKRSSSLATGRCVNPLRLLLFPINIMQRRTSQCPERVRQTHRCRVPHTPRLRIKIIPTVNGISTSPQRLTKKKSLGVMISTPIL